MNATLKPDVLQWARKKAGLSEEMLAKNIGVHLGLVKEWKDWLYSHFSCRKTGGENAHRGWIFIFRPPAATKFANSRFQAGKCFASVHAER